MEDMIRIAESFGVTPLCVYKTKYFYTVKCHKGEFRLIPTSLSEEKLRELFEIKERLFKSGLKVCDRFILSSAENICAEGEEGRYIMTEAVRGHNPEFENSSVMKEVFSALGVMHGVLRGIDCQRRDILEDYKKGISRLKAIKKQLGCSKRLNDFDIDFIKNYADFYEPARTAVKNLEELSFGVTSPIHGAVKEDNILVGRNVIITDWEMFRPGHFMEDTAQLIARYVRKYACKNTDFLSIDEILYNYTLHNPSDDRDIAVLYALLMYPKRFINICTKHYSGAHKFAPAGVRYKFEECCRQREFVLNYIGLK